MELRGIRLRNFKAATVFVALVVCAFDNGNAVASCGDYVKVAGTQRSSGSVRHFPYGEPPTVVTRVVAPAIPAQPESNHGPCFGPTCSHGLDSTLPAAPAPVNPVDPCCLAGLASVECDESVCLSLEYSSNDFIRCVLEIYHPPR
jgi:hypothetical protein